MRKILIVMMMIAFLCTYVNVASAYDGGLLNGKPMDYYNRYWPNSSPIGSTTAITDNNETTSFTMTPPANTRFIVYHFDTPKIINAYKFKASNNGGQLYIYLYGENPIKNDDFIWSDKTPNMTGAQVSFAPVANVHYAVIYNNDGSKSPIIYEFDVFGSNYYKLNPPTSIIGTPTMDTISVTWSPVTGATGYYIYVNGVRQNGLLTTTSYVINDLQPNTNYTIQLTSIDTYGIESIKSVAKVVKTLPPPDNEPPTVPVVTLKAGDKQVTVRWTSSYDQSGVAGYKVFRDSNLITPELVSGNSYLDTGLTNGVVYTYQVSAVDTLGNESALSYPVSIRPTSNFSVRLIPNKDSIVVQMANGYPPYTIDWGDGSITVNQTSYVINELEEDTDYTIKVKDSEGTEIIQIVNTGTLKGYVPPVFPAPDNIFQMMLDNFGVAGTIGIAIISAAIALGIIVILGIWGWRLVKKWLAKAR